MIEMELLGVRIEMPSSQPLVLLKELGSDRHLPIWIGTPEASAIAIAQQGLKPPRPLTHDLLCEVIAALGRSISHVMISSVEDAVFFAKLVLDDGTSIDSRASDALALALRAECRIWCNEEVMEEAGVVISDDDEEAPQDAEQEVQRFRAFLDGVDPEDFAN
ncbi:bifunctional nuclease family protein [Psychromicrobium sp. YIM B11713]|uniref:bifunctional nuclease family protein n=1 Tax=Psychromicrobium sp. YIM B11713 TaxID=3145233 RepID=UPI00374E91DF